MRRCLIHNFYSSLLFSLNILYVLVRLRLVLLWLICVNSIFIVDFPCFSIASRSCFILLSFRVRSLLLRVWSIHKNFFLSFVALGHSFQFLSMLRFNVEHFDWSVDISLINDRFNVWYNGKEKFSKREILLSGVCGFSRISKMWLSKLR